MERRGGGARLRSYAIRRVGVEQKRGILGKDFHDVIDSMYFLKIRLAVDKLRICWIIDVAADTDCILRLKKDIMNYVR